MGERRLIVPTKGDRLAGRLMGLLTALDSQGLVKRMDETEEGSDALYAALYEFADRELGDEAKEDANE